MKIASVITYSSYHNPFIERCIAEASKVSDEVVVVAYDHFFDGTEDTELKTELVTTLLRFSDYMPSPSRFYHNEARRAGYWSLGKHYDAVFFIDSDEILESDKVSQWLSEIAQKGEDYKLAHFWYYRDTCYRADMPEEGAVLVSHNTLSSTDMEWFGPREREGFSDKWNHYASYNNQVLGHHYSWAGTKEMIMRKVSSWGHNADNIDWKRIVEYEYSHGFKYKCPFKDYTFSKIEPYVGFTFGE